ncbi:lasso peptide biosynthesis B2 protein [Burkholderia sp. A1]|uniref:lasso peptide biosynthesis B2 protein n=1 Tax=Burkholderia sp. A1 TaxID=148446 RepID=UPI000A01E5D3|nr:lasso peptide biosynthesis B2 protein [Burkholderia sp. A1]
MYKHLRSDVFVAWFGPELVVFDIANDSYVAYSEGESHLIAEVSGMLPSIFSSERHRNAARALPIFKSGLYPDPDRRLGRKSPNERGTSLNCWRIRREDLRGSFSPIAVVQALRILPRVHRCSREERMAGLIRLLRGSRIPISSRMANRPSISHDLLVVSLNLACLVFPRRTKCLEWACTFVLMGRRYGYDFDMVVGVQNRPFFAHAWVELNGEIVGDDRGRRSQFSPIYDTARDG